MKSSVAVFLKLVVVLMNKKIRLITKLHCEQLLALSNSLCMGRHSIPQRTQCYVSCLSKQFNANTVTLCSLCLATIHTDREKMS